MGEVYEDLCGFERFVLVLVYTFQLNSMARTTTQKNFRFSGFLFLGEALDLLVYLFLDHHEIVVKSINRDMV
jgi:hypothetical protein